MRGVLRRLHREALRAMATPMGEDELQRAAMVFAPHPDDETVGCGGTLLLKRRLGAAVQLVFMTDGGASHTYCVTREEMRRRRAREAMEAAEVLGVDRTAVFQLDFPDGALEQHHAQAVTRVTELLEQYRPTQLFVPYAYGEHPDHVATHAIVQEAVLRTGRPYTIFEYPIWIWRHWPSVGWGRSWRECRAILAGSLKTGFGVRLLLECRTSVAIHDVMEQKREALARHVSQVQRQAGDERWRTLGDIDGGDFLDCLFQDREFYHRRNQLRR